MNRSRFILKSALIFTLCCCSTLLFADEGLDQERIKKALSEIGKTEIGKKLLDETKAIPIQVNPEMFHGYSARCIHHKGQTIVEINPATFDGEFFPLKFEITLFHELTHAKANLDIEIIEDEQNAYREALLFALDKISLDEALNKKLYDLYNQIEEIQNIRILLYESENRPAEGSEIFTQLKLKYQKMLEDYHKNPSNHNDSESQFLSDLAENLNSFKRNPGHFYFKIERQYRAFPHHSTFQEIQDFIEKYGETKILAIKLEDKDYFDSYIFIGDSRYRFIFFNNIYNILYSEPPRPA